MKALIGNNLATKIKAPRAEMMYFTAAVCSHIKDITAQKERFLTVFCKDHLIEKSKQKSGLVTLF